MTERKFTDEEVIKALECRMPHDKVCIEAYDLINRKNAEIDILIRKHDTLLDEIAEKDAEIDELEAENRGFSICLDNVIKTTLEIESKTIKEFAEIIVSDYPEMKYYLDNLVKEMTEEKND